MPAAARKTENISPEKMKFDRVSLRGDIQGVEVPQDESGNYVIKVRWSNSAIGMRYDWWTGENFYEKLEMQNVNMERLESGSAPFTKNHGYHDVDHVIGVVSEAWTEGEQGFAKVMLTNEPEAAPTINKIREGILRNVSIAYNFKSMERVEDIDDIKVYTAIDWEPFEVSIVGVGFDKDAGVVERARNETKNIREVTVMSSAALRKAAEKKQQKRTGETETAAAAEAEKKRAEDDDEDEGTLDPDTGTDNETETEDTPAPDADNDEAEDDEDEENTTRDGGDDVERAVAAERSRIQQIRSIGKKTRMKSAVIERAINERMSVAKFRKRAIDALADSQEPVNGRIETGGFDGQRNAKLHRSLVDGLAYRMGSRSEAANSSEFKRHTMVGIGRVLLGSRGIDTNRLADYQIAQRMMTTSDFPLLMQDASSLIVEEQYNQYDLTFLEMGRETIRDDFRRFSNVRMEGASRLQKKNEGGEYKNGIMREGGESGKLEKAGLHFDITDELVVNNSLGDLSAFIADVTLSAYEYQNEVVFNDILIGNPMMSDGNNLFSVAHGNLASPGTALTVTSLGVALKTIAAQNDASGKPLRLQPKFLVVGPDNMVIAAQIKEAITYPAVTENAVINKMRDLVIVEDPLIRGDDWFVVGNPIRRPLFEYAYLTGREKPETFVERTTNRDYRLTVEQVFTAFASDYRNGYKNPNVT